MASLSGGIRTSMKVEGLEELRKALRTLPVELQEKYLSESVASGAKVISTEAVHLAPVLKAEDPRRTPGLLKRMIRSTRGRRSGSEAAAFVSVRRLAKGALAKQKKKTGKSGAELDPFYWGFVEFGTSKNQAQSFMRKAFDEKKEAAVFAIARKLKDGIDKAAAKLHGRKF